MTLDYYAASRADRPLDTSRPYWAGGLIGIAAALAFAGYELVRSPANTLFKQAYGKEGLPYAMAATPLGVILILYVYGRLLTWLGPRRTLFITTVGSCALLLGSYLAIHSGYKPAAFALYVIREAYVVLLVEQYWSFLNSTLGDTHARRLNGPICGIGSAGSILGGMLVGTLATRLGTPALLILASAFTLPAAFVTDYAYRRCGEPEPRPAERRSDTLGLRMFAGNPLLIILLTVILLSQAVSGLTDLSFQGILQDRIPDANAQTAFSGWFFMWLNIASAAMQFGATPLLLRFLPVTLIHFVIPLIHVGTCLYLFRSPTLVSAGAAYLVFKTIDYSTFRAAKELLYIPLSFSVRYRAKELIDVFGYRFGKGGTSLLVSGLKNANIIPLAEPQFALGAAIAAALWAALAIPLGRGYLHSRRPRPVEPLSASSPTSA